MEQENIGIYRNCHLQNMATSIQYVLRVIIRLGRLKHVKRATLCLFLTLMMFMVLGIIEENGGVKQRVRSFGQLLVALTSTEPPEVVTKNIQTVLKFNNGEIQISDNHAQLHERLTTGSRDLVRVRSDIFDNDVINCTTSMRLGNWRLCWVGNYALADANDVTCLILYAGGDAGSREFSEAVGARLSNCSCTEQAYSSSGALTSKQHAKKADSKTTLSSLLTRAKELDVSINPLLVECQGVGRSALETAALGGQLAAVKQLVLRTPEVAQSPLHLVGLLSSLHRNGFRQWSHAVQRCSGHLTGHLNGNCWEQRFINMHYLVDKGNMARSPRFSKAEELQAVNLNSLTSERLEQLYHANVEFDHVICPINEGVGGNTRWDICFSPGFNLVSSRPVCVAFIFEVAGGNGSQDHFSEDLVDRYGCWAYVFGGDVGNSNTSYDSHRDQRETLWRYRARLGAKNTVTNEGVKVRTLCSIISRLGYTADRLIDIVKLDYEHQDMWLSLAIAIREGCLRYVKQLIFVSKVDKQTNYLEYLRVWQGLFGLGFRTWRHKLHDSKVLNLSQADTSGHNRSCCYDHYMINTKYSGLLRKSILD